MGLRVNEPEAARHIGIPLVSLKKLRKRGIAPKHIIINRRPYYDLDDLDHFVKELTVEPEDQR